MNDADCYRSNDTYAALTQALANVKPDLLTGRIEPWSFVEALGGIGGIWPASVLDDPERQATGIANTYTDQNVNKK